MDAETGDQIITYVGSVGYMCASFLMMWHNILFLIIIRYWQKIPDPFLGPKGVRGLLVLRGFAGYCVLRDLSTFPFLSPSHSQLRWSFWVIFLAPIPIFVRCDCVDIHHADSYWVLGCNFSSGALFSQADVFRM
jgi:hypothetical protein